MNIFIFDWLAQGSLLAGTAPDANRTRELHLDGGHLSVCRLRPARPRADQIGHQC